MSQSSTQALARDLREGADDVGRATRRASERVRADAREVVADIETASHVAADRAIGFARARPGVVLAMAAGLGAILALAFTRRSR